MHHQEVLPLGFFAEVRSGSCHGRRTYQRMATSRSCGWEVVTPDLPRICAYNFCPRLLHLLVFPSDPRPRLSSTVSPPLKDVKRSHPGNPHRSFQVPPASNRRPEGRPHACHSGLVRRMSRPHPRDAERWEDGGSSEGFDDVGERGCELGFWVRGQVQSESH